MSIKRKLEIYIPLTKFSMDQSLFIAYFLSTLLNVTFFLPMMVLPYLTKAQGVSDATFGYAQTLFGFFQIIGGPIFGYIIKSYGVKNSLFVCYTCNLLMVLILCWSQSVYGLMLSRVPTIFLHGQQAHQALIASLTKPGQERTNAFGRMGFTFGIGFVLSPIISAAMTKIFGELAPLWTAIGICMGAMGIAYVFVDEHELKTLNDDPTKNSQNLTLKSAYLILHRPNVLNIYVKKSLVLSPMLIIFSIMQLHLINKFGVSQEKNGIMQVFVGFNLMFINGFGIVWLRNRLDETKLMVLGTISVLITLLQFCFLEYFWQMWMIIPTLALGITLTGTVSDSVLTASVQQDEQGIILGLVNATQSFMRTIGPAFGGFMMDKYGFSSIGYLGMATASLAMVGHFVVPLSERKLDKNDEKVYKNGANMEKEKKEL